STATQVLLEQLGIKEYLLDKQCQHTISPWSGASASGWSTECPRAITVKDLDPAVMRCHIPNDCASFYCCVRVAPLNQYYQTSLHLDTNTFKLTVSVEKFRLEFNLLDIEWDKEQHLYLFGLIRIDYTLKDLVNERAILLTYSVSICLSATCEQIPIFGNAKFPKPALNWELPPLDPNFNVSNWLRTYGKSLQDGLVDWQKDLLLEKLGVASYFSNMSCDRAAAPYSPSNDRGWNIECPKQLTVPKLPSGLKCHVSKSCDAFECCMYLPMVDRTARIYLQLDNSDCNFKIIGGIEKLRFEKLLLDYEFGMKDQISLNNFINIDFQIDDLSAKGMFLINLDISMCLDHATCLLDASVFQNLLVPKTVCSGNIGFLSTAFNFSQWLSEKSQSLTSIMVDNLLEMLGVTQFLQDPPGCTHTQGTPWIN
ncbi:hypothetical protein CHS0354_035944, partial [Potamilus streckersoni]